MDVTIERAAELIRAGELVAFPTETVYGLGANALDSAAVAKIFALKGRPATSPLIVHAASIGMAGRIVSDWPPEAEALARKFWPGPLTLVLPKAPAIPDIATAGLPTVGVRVPAHPTARALIEAAGVPIAAPSANRFTELSPTTAEHVRESFGDDLAVIPGEGCEVGIESTVVSIANGKVMLLRPGMIAFDEIERTLASGQSSPPQTFFDARPSILGAQPPTSNARPACTAEPAASHPTCVSSSENDALSYAHASPGMHARHYSPRTKLILVHGLEDLPDHQGAYLWRTRPGLTVRSVRMPMKAAAYANRLYRVLHDVDRENWPWIAVELPPDKPLWAAILDRLRRAANQESA